MRYSMMVKRFLAEVCTAHGGNCENEYRVVLEPIRAEVFFIPITGIIVIIIFSSNVNKYFRSCIIILWLSVTRPKAEVSTQFSLRSHGSAA